MAVVAAGAVACGSSSDDGGVEDTGVSATIDPAVGGTVAYPGGPTLFIPEGALSTTTPTAIRIRQGGWSLSNTRMFLFEPAGVSFRPSKEATVSFPFDPNVVGTTNATVYWTQPGVMTYDALPTTVAGSVARAQVQHFSWAHLGAPCATDVACAPIDDCKFGLLACTAGAPSCLQGNSVPNGTPCGTAGVCRDGACGAACNTIPLTGTSPLDPVYFASTELPTRTGGAVADGTYFLSTYNSYGTSFDPGVISSTQQVLVVQTVSGGVRTVNGAVGALGGTDSWTATMTPKETTPPALEMNGSCGRVGVFTYEYSASPTELKLYFFDRDTRNWFEEIYLKQPDP
jgi:hypothetical protein